MLVFPKDALLRFNGNRVSDHNRSPLEISTERIGRQVRTVNGTLRKYHVADKKTFSVSWEMLPHMDSKTVDGFWGANSLRDFFNSTTGEFTLTIENFDGTEINYTVVFTDFSRTLNKRWGANYYDVSLTMEQV